VRADTEQVSSVQSLLAATSDPEHPDQVNVSRPSEALVARAAAQGAFNSLFLGLAAVALLVGGVGVANIMVISVMERRSEIGRRRALGATRGQIRVQFLGEAALLGLLGGVVGVAVGAAVTAAYALSHEWDAVVPTIAITGGLGHRCWWGRSPGCCRPCAPPECRRQKRCAEQFEAESTDSTTEFPLHRRTGSTSHVSGSILAAGFENRRSPQSESQSIHRRHGRRLRYLCIGYGRNHMAQSCRGTIHSEWEEIGGLGRPGRQNISTLGVTTGENREPILADNDL
jgi:hypothetical protein